MSTWLGRTEAQWADIIQRTPRPVPRGGCEAVGVCRFCSAEVAGNHVCELMAVAVGSERFPFGSAV